MDSHYPLCTGFIHLLNIFLWTVIVTAPYVLGSFTSISSYGQSSSIPVTSAGSNSASPPLQMFSTSKPSLSISITRQKTSSVVKRHTAILAWTSNACWKLTGFFQLCQLLEFQNTRKMALFDQQASMSTTTSLIMWSEFPTFSSVAQTGLSWSKHEKVQMNAYLTWTHTMHIFREIPFIKPQNDT